MRWVVWIVLLVATSGTSTLASRARNTASYAYHTLAALGSHGTFIAAQLVGLDILIEALRGHDRELALRAALVYTLASTAGSVLMHWLAIHFFENGHRRVGGY